MRSHSAKVNHEILLRACGRFYQFRRPPSTMMRLLLALPNPVKRPNVTESILLSRVALEKSGWLVEFRKSARNSKLNRSVIGNRLARLASKLKKLGLVKNVCARLPSVPGSGFCKITPLG